MTKKTLILSSLLTCLSFEPAFAQFGEKFVISAVKADAPPVIDGKVDEEVWKTAPSAGDFIQFVPTRGDPASVKTVVKLLYDSNNIYFAFLCEDPESGKIQLGANRRDGLASTTGTDSVTIELDTFNDDRTAYFFRTNPLGVQHDGRITDNGLVDDIDWDGVWPTCFRTEIYSGDAGT